MAKILLGLDIGSQTIKAVQLSKDKNSATLLAAGFIATPAKTAILVSQNEEVVLGNSISRLVHDMKITTRDVSASLPTSQVITRIIEVPFMSEAELDSSIKWEAEQYIPWQLAKVKIDYSIIDKKESVSTMRVLLAAAPITLIEKYMKIISAAGLNPVSLETEVLATARCLGINYPTLKTLLFTTIGATSTEIGLLRDGVLIYSKTMPIGGNTLTRAISEELGFELPQAEEYKKTYGLEEDKLEGKIAKIISPFFTNIIEEMEKTVAYCKNQFPNEEITTSIVSGGSAKLPGLVLSITKSLGLDSQIVNPFLNINVDPNVLPVVSPDSPLYTTSIGLALKEI